MLAKRGGFETHVYIFFCKLKRQVEISLFFKTDISRSVKMTPGNTSSQEMTFNMLQKDDISRYCDRIFQYFQKKLWGNC